MKIGELSERLIVVGLVVALTLIGTGAASPRSAAAQVSIDCADVPEPGPGEASPDADPASPEVVADSVSFPEDGGEITVFAAASLTDVFTQMGEDISEVNPNVSVEFNFAGSRALVTQLTEGAEADVFASANMAQMDAAVEAGVIEGDASIFAHNQLVIIVPDDNPAGLTGAADLGKEGILLDIAQEDVPAGQYTRQSVCLMNQHTETFGNDFAEQVSANIVSEESNVRAVVTKVAIGEADAGVVYATDVTADVVEQVQIIEIPAGFNVVAEYPLAAVAGGDAALAEAFIGYVLSPEGQATLEHYGFEPGS